MRRFNLFPLIKRKSSRQTAYGQAGGSESRNCRFSKVVRLIDRLFFPFAASWAIVLYIHAVQTVYVYRKLPLNLGVFLFFIPVIAWEYLVSDRFRRLYSKSDSKTRLASWAFILNGLFWLVFFCVWVIHLAYASQFTPAFQLYGTYFFMLTLPLWFSMSWMAPVGVGAWIGCHAYFTLARGRFRILTSVCPYFLLTLAFFAYQWYLGGLGSFTAEKVARQPGVEQVFDIDDLQAAMDKDVHLRWKVLRPPNDRFLSRERIRAVPNARGIWVDNSGSALYLTYGVTYAQGLTYPMLVRKDLGTSEIVYVLTDSNLRQTWHTEDSIFLAPWHDPNIYVLSSKDLSLQQVFGHQVPVPSGLWEPMSIIKDKDSDHIVVSTEFYPSLFKYDLASGYLLNKLPLYAYGYMGKGDTAYYPIQSTKTGKMYFVLCPGKADLIEVDPSTLKVSRTLDLGWTLGTALAMDRDCTTLFFQSGIWNDLHALDIATFKPKRTYRGAVHARTLVHDEKRNALYILDYSGGRLIAMDLNSGEFLWTLQVGGRPHDMCMVNDSAWVHSMAGAFKVDLKTQWAGREKAS